ncbi:hypothetical protein KFE25_009510 [Diacronema lutheri]|uniref:Uncharacterized protein n=2 Tax=Diacronema lutheri TaxID=2081491 RepID=A0A8J5XUY3_DIALT|nr:hypothetical protein KFE25_009510 [Diacronema lutheri]
MARPVAALLALVGAASALRAPHVGISRRDMSRAVAFGAAAQLLPAPSWGAGSSDLKTDRVVAMRKYAPRVFAGRDYWAGELPRQISASDWKAINAAISIGIDPKDKKGKRQQFGTILAMVGPLELWASSFSRSAQRSPETGEMLAAVDEFKAALELLELATASTVKDTGLFGFFGGKKEPTAAEREKNARQALARGSKALNNYFKVLNGFLVVMDEATIKPV